MAAFSDQDRQKLADYIRQSLDQGGVTDMESFARDFLHNSKVWDLLAEAFPDAPPSAVKGAMMEAYAKWSDGRQADKT